MGIVIAFFCGLIIGVCVCFIGIGMWLSPIHAELKIILARLKAKKKELESSL